jgi:hypothetical protein
VLGHLRLGEPELADQVADRPLLVGQQIDDLPPARLGHRVERVGRGRCSGHAATYIPIWECVKGGRRV